jgi:hypothetical protein
MPTAIIRRRTVVLPALGLLVLLALATAPLTEASTINACVKKKGGAVRIVTKAAKCKKRETKESWANRGITGRSGASGAVGAIGGYGANGVAGATGPAGASTETGTSGATGVKGSSGSTGPTGATGETGAGGASGPKGATGPSGSTGATGETGAVGATGNKGVTGTSGPTGETGAAGATGSSGAVGGYSASIVGPVDLTNGTQGSPTPVLTKNLPAGSFIVSSKLVVTATDTSNEATWVVRCMLSDKPSTGATTEDVASATGAVVTDFILHKGEATMPLGMAITTSTSSTLTLACALMWDTSITTHFELLGSNALITAIQTTQNT